MYNFRFLSRLTMTLFLLVPAILPLMADTENANTSLPDIPAFSITYLGKVMTCSPTALIKKSTHKDLLNYQCRESDADHSYEKQQDEQRGNDETKRLIDEVKQNIKEGVTFSVNIPMHAVNSPARARFIAQEQLYNRPYGKYLRMLLPAKFYLSIRPQIANSGDNGKMELQNSGTRGGFFYYYQFKNHQELIFQYEAKVDWNSDTPFINISSASNSNRRLSYVALKDGNNSILAGKYWSAYYDIAGLTDRYMAYGAQASGAYNAGTDGGPSGTGRADTMLQARRNGETYDATIQVQFKHDALRGFDTDYRYAAAGSLSHKKGDNIKIGASVNYGKFDDITSQMQAVGIDGNDLSFITGVSYQKNNYLINAILSYTKNHMNDDQGIYFDGVGAELYMQYDISDGYRLATGGNWLIPRENSYDGKYSIKDFIFSFQYSFGNKTFDDLVYMEVSLPKGKLSNGENRSTNIAIGLRYLFAN